MPTATHIVGLTGGIGSGKSTIAAELQRRGYLVYDTDREAKRLMTTPAVCQAITELLGAESYRDGELNRPWVAQQIFQNAALRTAVNQIVHPAVVADVQRWAQSSRQPIVFVESALLYESHLDKACDWIVAVVAPEAISAARAALRDHTTEAHIAQRQQTQMSNKTLAELANSVIHNDGEQSIVHLVDQLLAELPHA